MSIFSQRYFNLDHEYRLYLSRFNIGLHLAALAAAGNLYHLRQTVLKQAVWVAGSTRLARLVPALALVAPAYLVALTAVWTLPSLAVESSVRLYDATAHVVLNWVVSPKIVRYVLTGKFDY
jgi:hypothetical protein